MALYLGGKELKLNLNGKTYNMNICSVSQIIKDILLSSSDDCILKDFDGVYLLPKEEN